MEINFKGKKRKYQFSTSDRQFVLSEVNKVKDGKTKGELAFSPIGYFSTIEEAINRTVHIEIHDSEAKSFKELFKVIKDLKAWIATIVSKSIE